jgi:uncharacterized protein (TIGR00255 family)
MKSMTGYGRATGVILGDTLTVQVSAVNRKTLDLTMKLPPDWESLESAVGECVRRYAARGKVHVQIELTGAAGAPEEIWDEDAAANVLDRLSGFAARQGVAFTPTAELLWEIARAQRKSDDFPSAESAQATVLATVEIALRAFAAMRAKEGESLLIDFLGRFGAILRVAVHALVKILRDVVALNAVRNQRRLFLEVTWDGGLVLFGTEHVHLRISFNRLDADLVNPQFLRADAANSPQEQTGGEDQCSDQSHFHYLR